MEMDPKYFQLYYYDDKHGDNDEQSGEKDAKFAIVAQNIAIATTVSNLAVAFYGVFGDLLQELHRLQSNQAFQFDNRFVVRPQDILLPMVG